MEREGMNAVTFETDAFRLGLSTKIMGHLLVLVYRTNLEILPHLSLPSIYQSGVVYREEPMGIERWKDAMRVLHDGYGDCEDLACWRAAELTLSGIRAVPVFKSRMIAGNIRLYHILVKRADGIIEDPSYVLGMRPGFNASSPASWRE